MPIAKKRCSKCGKNRPLSQFASRGETRGGAPAADCRQCHREYVNDHYARNREYYIKKAKAQREKLRQLLVSLKIGKPCADCGEEYEPCGMDFDHPNGDKDIDVSRLVSYGSEKRLREEIAKCEVVCAVCHRMRTHARSNSV